MEFKKRKVEEVEADEREEDEDEEEEDEEDAATGENDVSDEENGDAQLPSEDVRSLIEPFSKEKLVELLQKLVSEHPDIFPEIMKFADDDVAHRKLFVRGLGWDISSDVVKKVFSKFGEIEECTIIQDKQTGRSKGYGFVTFKRRDSARSALKSPSKRIEGRATWCQLAAAGPTAPTHAPSADDPVHRKIYVGNVPVDLAADKILRFFSQYGEIEEGPLGYDKKTGRSKGFALFIYKTVEGAKKALKEPGKSIDGHQVYCKLASEGHKQKSVTYVHSSGGDTVAAQAPGIMGSAPLPYGTLPGVLQMSQGVLNQHSLVPSLPSQGLFVSGNSGLSQGLLVGGNSGLTSIGPSFHPSVLQQLALSSTLTTPYNHSLNSLPPSAATSGLSQVPLGSYGYHSLGHYGSQTDSALLQGLPPSSVGSQSTALQGLGGHSSTSKQRSKRNRGL